MSHTEAKATGHESIETSNFLMIVLILVAVAIGGLVEIVPLFFQRSTTQPVAGLKPYDALQLAGRDVYLREGCYNCHSQMIRRCTPRRCATATTRWPGSSSTTGRSSGAASAPGRTCTAWAESTATSGTACTSINPRDLVPESNMPAYAWLRTGRSTAVVASRMPALKRLGVPYSDEEIEAAPKAVQGKTDLDALVAYLQVLGTP